jgi:hypothetical protein
VKERAMVFLYKVCGKADWGAVSAFLVGAKVIPILIDLLQTDDQELLEYDLRLIGYVVARVGTLGADEANGILGCFEEEVAERLLDIVGSDMDNVRHLANAVFQSVAMARCARGLDGGA